MVGRQPQIARFQSQSPPEQVFASGILLSPHKRDSQSHQAVNVVRIQFDQSLQDGDGLLKLAHFAAGHSEIEQHIRIARRFPVQCPEQRDGVGDAVGPQHCEGTAFGVPKVWLLRPFHVNCLCLIVADDSGFAPEGGELPCEELGHLVRECGTADVCGLQANQVQVEC